MLVLAHVDLFSLYRSDVRVDLAAGRVGPFDVNDSFLVLATVYVLVPAVMVYLSLAMPPRIGRPVLIAVAGACDGLVVAS